MNTIALLAQAGLQGWSIGQIAIAIVVVCGVIALVWVAMRQFGISIPAWVQQVLWIVAVVVVVILAIKFIISLW
jgi:hypothetical protein